MAEENIHQTQEWRRIMFAKAKAAEAVDNMRHPERLARAKSQAESLLSFANPFTGLIIKAQRLNHKTQQR